MIELPNKKKCYNLPEQVAQNLLNIQYLAEQYKNIDELPSIWADYKTAFDADLHTFEDWTTTFEGWENTLATYLANMSSAAVGAIAGQNIAPANISATGNITAPSIIETMTGYSYYHNAASITPIYVGAVKNGNKLTLVLFAKMKNPTSEDIYYGAFGIPSAVGAQLYPYTVGLDNVLSQKNVLYFDSASVQTTPLEGYVSIQKNSNTTITVNLRKTPYSSFTADKDYFFRIEVTFLLADNLAS